ncbi:hypothetical protein QPW83_00810 [Legionella pneumophila]|nr:hypothetical protein [Legionella pneumophila subsp. fraseri]MDW9041266.1 hypothetical protein [Legionella pneumophila subsp. fraseri]MDW9062818.1 hypothetical protein [Legionella pneumophila subsp. fraseri]HBC1992301.1 hypothetical protein [Legionella pneumophila]HCX7829350.1 hypothetical protein [Legionella pneumophila]
MTDFLRTAACQQHPQSKVRSGCLAQSSARRLLNESFKKQVIVNYY